MKYNGCPDSEILAEYFKRFNYDPNRREEILKKYNLLFDKYIDTTKYSPEEQITILKNLNKRSWRKNMNNKPLGYLGGDIMTFGSNLAREYEYEQFKKANIPGEVYSPVQNKSINDKSNMTEEENNHLAEKIVAADVERLWNSDYTVLCPEQSAIGTMCEMGILYGWKYMLEQFGLEMTDKWFNNHPEKDYLNYNDLTKEDKAELFDYLIASMDKQSKKSNYAHYFDIRTNHLNEKDWRRSFSINQFLYGIILAATADGTLHNSFDEILPILKEKYENE